MKNLIKFKEGKRSKIRFIIKKITKENSNWLELFQGESGSGKTWSAISQALDIDPDFDVEKQLVFTFSDLMKIINSDWFKKKKTKVLIFDEPQIQISNREWQSLINRLFNFILTSFRHQNIVLLFCCPWKDFLDSSSMKMIHCISEMISINKKTKLTRTKPKLQQYNSKLKKTYEHCIFVLRNKRVHKMVYDYIPKPPQNIINTYERMKTDFTSKLNKDIERQLDKLEDSKQEKDMRKPLTKKQEQAIILVQAHKKIKEVAEIMGISLKNVYKHLELAKKKGYTPETHLSPIFTPIHPLKPKETPLN